MDWARNHLRWPAGHWQLYRIDSCIRVRRQKHEAYNEDCIVPRVQAEADGVTI